MGELVKSSMEGRMKRILNDTAKLERMQYREKQKELRENHLMKLKKSTLPMIEPKIKKYTQSKCRKCDIGNEKFVKHEDWHLPEMNALTMEVETKGWKKWAEVVVVRKFLSMSIESLIFHPAHINMLKNLETKNVPVMFVLQSERFETDAILVNFVLWLNKIELPVAFVDNKMKRIPVIGRILDDLKIKVETKIDAGEILKQQNLLVKFESFEKLLKEDESLEKIKDVSKKSVKFEDDIFGDDDNFDQFSESDSKQPSKRFTKLPNNTYIVPVTINCEKHPQNSILKWRSQENFGIVKLNFHEPYTIPDFLKSNDIPNYSSKNVNSIDNHLKYDLAMKRPVMATHVVAFLMLTKFRDGVTAENLAVELDRLRNDRYKIDFGFEGDSIDIVERGIELLGGKLIESEGKKVQPKNFQELSSYAKVLTPHFALESILAIAGQQLKRSKTYIDYNELITNATDLVELFQIEIPLLLPCEKVENQLRIAFDRLSQSEVMSKPPEPEYTESEHRARRIAKQLESDSEESDDDGYQQIPRNSDNEVTLLDEIEIAALKNAIFPILETYLTVACCLKHLLKGRRLTTEEFHSLSLQTMREECEDGNCKTWESCSIPWIKSCLECLELWKMIDVNDNLIGLTHDYDNKKAIQFLISRIERFFNFTAM